jgi:signal peptidase I
MEKRKAAIEALDWVKAIAIAIVVAIGLRMFVFEIVRVQGPSMQDTLYTGQRVYVDKLFHKIGGLKRGDVVECYYTRYDNGKDSYIKRVIGLGGETVEISNGKIFIDGIEYDDPQFDEVERNSGRYEGKWKVPEGCYFVVGDNRLDSNDSRMSMVGCIPEKDIIGKGVFVIWPLNEIKILKNE